MRFSEGVKTFPAISSPAAYFLMKGYTRISDNLVMKIRSVCVELAISSMVVCVGAIKHEYGGKAYQ